MDKFSDVINSDYLRALDGAQEERETLQRAVDDNGFTSEAVERAYKFHLAKANEKLYEIMGDPNVQQEIAAIGTNALKSIEQIEKLEDMGLSTDDLNVEMKEQESRVAMAVSALEKCEPNNDLAKQFMKVVVEGGSVATAQVVVKESEDKNAESPNQATERVGAEMFEQEQSGEQEKRQVSLKISSKAVRIGGQGKLVPFRPRDQKGARDYSAERKAALVFMVKNQDREVTPNEMWDHIKNETGADDEIFYDTMKAVRSWFDNVTHRRTPIFQHNGVKGSGSRYSVNPDIELSISEKSHISYDKPEIELTAFDEQVTSNDLLETQESYTDTGITSRDLCLVATKLANNNRILDGYGLPTVDRDVLQELSRSARDVVAPEGVDIDAERYDAFSKVIEMIKDEDSFIDYIDGLDEESPEYRFIEYFFDIDDPEDQELVKRIIYSRTTHRFHLQKGANLVTNGEGVVFDSHGEQIWPIPDGVEVRPKVSQAETSELVVDPSVAEQCPNLPTGLEENDKMGDDLGGGMHGEIEDLVPSFVRSNGEIVEDQRRQDKLERRKKFDEIKDGIKATAVSLKNDYNFTSQTGNQLSHAQYISMPGANGKIVSEALAANLLEQNERDPNKAYSGREILVVAALKMSRNTFFDVTNRKTVGAKAVHRAIDEVIDEVWG